MGEFLKIIGKQYGNSNTITNQMFMGMKPKQQRSNHHMKKDKKTCQEALRHKIYVVQPQHATYICEAKSFQFPFPPFRYFIFTPLDPSAMSYWIDSHPRVFFYRFSLLETERKLENNFL